MARPALDCAALARSLEGRESLRVVVADSGLGGLSICARLAANLAARSPAPAVELVYFNAWPEQGRGYNRLDSDAERARVLDAALEAMAGLEPDIILLACNTLSVLLERTAFAARPAPPVLDIVGFGADMVHRALTAEPLSRAVLLGTLTTIASGAHLERLTAMGVDSDRVLAQSCDQLATAIEKGPDGPEARARAEACLRAAAGRVAEQAGGAPPLLHAALCCTHYEYARDLMASLLAGYCGCRVQVLSPNRAMADCLVQGLGPGPGARVSVRVLSRIPWDEERIRAIGRIVEPVSPATAQALRGYVHDPQLFTF